MKLAVFLDRDGVLVADVDLLTRPEEFRILPGVPESLCRLHRSGFAVIVVSNQPVVARGLLTEASVGGLHRRLQELLTQAGAPPPAGWYFCPHHPDATLPQYRLACDCRKPSPGLLLRAAQEHGLACAASFMVGDRITDIIAGARAGCRTVLVETGKHLAPPITTREPLDLAVRPDYVCADLTAATEWIVGGRKTQWRAERRIHPAAGGQTGGPAG